MTSVTAVPLRPIKKGSLTRLWLAMLFIVLVVAALVWAGMRPFGRTESGLHYQVLKEGTGPRPAHDDFVQVTYKGTLVGGPKDGKVFDETPQPTPMDLSNMIPGFAEAVTLMNKGERIRVTIPPQLAYGSEAKGDVIPANSTLAFEITLYDFKTRAELQEMQRQMQMQQMMQQLQQRGGAPGGQPGAAPAPAPEGAPQPQ